MANVRAPDIDFTLNTPGNRLSMPGIASNANNGYLVSPMEPIATQPQPKGSVLASGGGGGGAVTYSTPITG